VIPDGRPAKARPVSPRARPARRAGLPVFAALLLAWGCGGSEAGVDEAAFGRACEEVPGCAASRDAAAVPRETIYRVQVVRAGSGEVRIGGVEPIAVTAGEGVPLGRLAGSHMVVGLDAGGAPVDGQVIAFPGVLRAEPADGWSPPATVDLEGREVDTFGYVRANEAIEEIAVLDEAGDVVARADAPDARTADAGPTPDRGSWPRAPALVSPAFALQPGGSGPALPAHCAHVRILEGEADRDLARGVAHGADVELVRPGPTQRAVIHGALGLMTPLLCHGISRIAVGDVPEEPGLGGVVRQLSTGDMMLLNVAAGYTEDELAGSAEQRLRMIHTLIHETAHAAEALLNAEGSRPAEFTGDWTPPSRDLAAETIERVRLEKSLIIEWQRVHLSFVDQGWAAPYGQEGEARQAARERSAGETAQAGFMSRYAGTFYAEDIAETVAWTYLGDAYRDAGIPEGPRQTEDYGCQRMRAHDGDGVPSRFAAVYTKLHFLKDLGLVRPGDVDACTGPVALPNDEPGFHFWQDDEYRRTFGRAVTAVIGTAPSGRYVFEMKAEGEAAFGDETHPARVRLVLDLAPGDVPVEQVPWPRGVYELGLLAGYDLGNLANRAGATAGSGFSLRLEGARAGDFDVYEGFALVAEASNERIAGSLVVQRAMRLSAPLPVPQTWDPPLVVRFGIEK